MQRHLKFIRDLLKGKPAHLRSPEWHRVEKEHLEKEPSCQWCGGTQKLQVHHVTPFHLAPALELDPGNLITLCEEGGFYNCHLAHGHNGDWKSFNDQVREQCNCHRSTPDRQLLEAIRKVDPSLYGFLTHAKKEKSVHHRGTESTEKHRGMPKWRKEKEKLPGRNHVKKGKTNG